MKIETKFSPGDTVYAIEAAFSKTIKKKCPACKGTGKLKGVNNKYYGCSNCAGRGSINTLQSIWKMMDISLEVYGVATYTARTDKKLIIEEQYSVGSANYDSEHCDYTFNAEHLFATAEEAQVECKRLNKRRTR